MYDDTNATTNKSISRSLDVFADYTRTEVTPETMSFAACSPFEGAWIPSLQEPGSAGKSNLSGPKKEHRITADIRQSVGKYRLESINAVAP